jgi:hypothetical protein
MPPAELAVEVGEVFEAAGVTGLGDRAAGLAEEFAGVAETNVIECLGETATGYATEESAKRGWTQANAGGEIRLKDGLSEVCDEMAVYRIDPRLASRIVLWRESRRAKRPGGAISGKRGEDLNEMREPAGTGFVSQVRKGV